MKLVKQLQECTTIGQAEPILKRLHAGPAVKKLVETAILLSNSNDPQQRNHAYSFMQSAIQEMDDEKHDDDLPFVKEEDSIGMHSGEDELDNHKMKEEVLDNHNLGPREEGSEQSSENEEPYTGEGKDTTTGEKPMQDMDAPVVNQWNETGGFPPGAGMGQPPMGQPPMGQPPMGQMPGLAPDVAQEMGMIMPNIPPMDTSQMMRQMQYTLESYHKRIVSPMNRLIIQQREAIKSLSKELRETKQYNGTMKLDIDNLRTNATAKFRETEGPIDDSPMYKGVPMSGLQPQTTRKKDTLDKARNEISEMDRIIRQQNNSIYN